MSEGTIPVNKIPLGDLIRLALEQRHMTGRGLAREAQVGVTTIQNLLKVGTEEAEQGAHPLVLQKVARVLDLDQIQVFEAAGYIALDEEEVAPPTLTGEYVRHCFEALPEVYQRALISVLHAMLETAGNQVDDALTQELLETANRLREQYALFRKPFGVRREVGRVLGNVTRTTTRGLLLRAVLERINRAYDVAETYSPEEVLAVVRHPHALVILNFLLPHPEIPTGLEKLYWLCHDADHAGQRGDRLPPDDRAGIRALWEALAGATRHSRLTARRRTSVQPDAGDSSTV